MNFEEVNILELLPQQPPFVMVEKFLRCDWKTTKTSLSINNDNIFVENGLFSQSGIIESVAQTCAARMGYLIDNQNVKIGMIGSINDFEFTGILPKVGNEIFTEICVEAEIGSIVLLNSKTICDENLIATGKMKVVLTNTDAKMN
ncbi:MAG: pseudouridylate synthase [Prevotellaceae bacterium]|jgi:3-hydroxymyristoyl/3-hydroxydecanoyl-(acyl carrier protein) dehydratase|nr:pseudouridylate synthase [Prevotellaceae bacterium]